MVTADIPQVGDLLRRYLGRFDVAQTFSNDEEVQHWFLSGQGREGEGRRVEQVVWAYVVEVGLSSQAVVLSGLAKESPQRIRQHTA